MMKKIRFIIVIIILCVFNVVYSFVTKEEKIYNSKISSSDYSNVGGMYNDQTVSQQFHCNYQNLSELTLRFATYDRDNYGEIRYEILDKEDNNIVAEGNIDISKIANNEFNIIKFNSIEDSKDKDYILYLNTRDSIGDNVVTIYSTESDNAADVLLIDEEIQQNTSLVMTVVCKNVFDVETFVVLICFEIYCALFFKVLYKFLA